MSAKEIFVVACFTILVNPLNAFADAPVAPDSSKMNSKTELSAQDQGNSKEDIAVTSQIRQQVVKHDDFSTDAKNIKIITLNGQVTLKGPVKSEAEKNEIQKIAFKVAGKNRVSNQIEIKQ